MYVGQRVKIVRPPLIFDEVRNATGTVVDIDKEAIYPIYVKLDEPIPGLFEVYACIEYELEPSYE